MIFPFFKIFGFLGILDPPYCGIGATIRIGQEMLCLPYAGFFDKVVKLVDGGSVINKAYPSSLYTFRFRIFNNTHKEKQTLQLLD